MTVQLPIYNEQHVVIRLLRACANLRYPREKLQIQVLDDSDDDTRELIQREVAHLRASGTVVEIVERPTRHGYKAGALAHALATAQGEFIAIFDADFEPTEDFLGHTLPYFFNSDNQSAGFIQTRWDHLNANYSPLTQSQALALDGHFAIEQPARHRSGYFFGFNGSGGIWRRACIEDAAVGGWHTDTLCEDLDLSYRAQLAGWHGIFLPHVTAPAEVPPQLLAFKRQQFRWAKGSIQTLRKLAPRLVQADLPLRVKVQALLHLGGYWVHPFLLLMLLVTLPIRILPFEPIVPLSWLGYTSLGPPLLYAVAQQRLRGRLWWQRWRYIPLLTLMGIGLSFNNTRAVFQGLFHTGGEFLRTPKFNVEKKSDQWNQSAYRLRVPTAIVAELFLMLYAIAICFVLVQQRDWWSLPFILLYAAGFGFMAGTGIWQARAHTRRQPSGVDTTSVAHAKPRSTRRFTKHQV
ncbi:MAG: glycosyltransferase [Litorilinea sp.]